jgi:hypothetical protein
MNSVEPSSPQAQLPVGVPRSKRPSSVPSWAMIKSPPGAAAKIFPWTSTFKLSATPRRPLEVASSYWAAKKLRFREIDDIGPFLGRTAAKPPAQPRW